MKWTLKSVGRLQRRTEANSVTAMTASPAETALAPYLDRSYALVLRTIAQSGPASIEAYTEWRALTPLSAVPFAQHRAFPMLADFVTRENIAEREYERLRGVSRNLFTRNAANLHHLRQVLDLMAQQTIAPILLSGLALHAHKAVRLDGMALGALELLIPAAQFHAAKDLFKANAYRPGSERPAPDNASWHPPSSDRLIILRTSPLPSLTNRHFVQECIAASHMHQFQDRHVRLLSPTELLFCACVQPAIHDDIACFTAILQGHALLAIVPNAIDWVALQARIRRHGLQAYALAYFQFLTQHTAHDVPSTFMAALNATVRQDNIDEWMADRQRATRRSIGQKAGKAYRDLRFSRHSPSTLVGKIIRSMTRRLGR